MHRHPLCLLLWGVLSSLSGTLPSPHQLVSTWWLYVGVFSLASTVRGPDRPRMAFGSWLGLTSLQGSYASVCVVIKYFYPALWCFWASIFQQRLISSILVVACWRWNCWKVRILVQELSWPRTDVISDWGILNLPPPKLAAYLRHKLRVIFIKWLCFSITSPNLWLTLGEWQGIIFAIALVFPNAGWRAKGWVTFLFLFLDIFIFDVTFDGFHWSLMYC